jgi:hypothetical protein
MTQHNIKKQIINGLISLYPHRWRTRYAEEFAVVLAEMPLSFPAIADVCQNAIAAHCHYGREARRIQAEYRARRRRAGLIAFLILWGCPVAPRQGTLSVPRSFLS